MPDYSDYNFVDDSSDPALMGLTSKDLSGSVDSWDSSVNGGDSATSPTSSVVSELSGIEALIAKLPAGLQKLVTTSSGNVDWTKLLALGAATGGGLGLFSAKKEPTGYQGGIPALTATRTAINYNDPNRIPGSAGRQYFTDIKYADSTDAAKVAAAKAAGQAEAADIASKYQFAPQTTRQDVYQAYAMTPGAIKNPTESAVNYWQNQGLAGFRDAVDAYNRANPKTTPIASVPPATLANTARMPWESPPTTTNTQTVNQQVAPLTIPKAEDLQMNQKLAHGGIAGRYLRGNTDGMADKIDTSIDDHTPAKLSHGEFVIPADVVSHLGNGNSEAGADKLYDMMAKIRKARTGNPKQGKEIDPDKFMPGGHVPGYAGPTDGSLVNANNLSGLGVTGTESSLSNWAGPYVTNMLGQGAALANQPYQAYQGPLTAGESGLQSQAFQGIGALTVPTGMGQAAQTAGDVVNKAGQLTYTPTKFTSGVFDTAAANQYMNPYIQSALNPQLAELKRQSDIARLGDAARLSQAGAYGGSRQAIMESEGNRNLLAKQNEVLGTGYANAYDKAMAQFNADQARNMTAQQGTEASRQFSAGYGLQGLQQQLAAAQAQSQLGAAEQNANLANLSAQLSAGNTQRGITAEGIAADKAQFEEQRDNPYKMVQFQQGLLQGLPLSAQSYTTTTPTALQQANGALVDLASILKNLNISGA